MAKKNNISEKPKLQPEEYEKLILDKVQMTCISP